MTVTCGLTAKQETGISSTAARLQILQAAAESKMWAVDSLCWRDPLLALCCFRSIAFEYGDCRPAT